MEGGSREKRRLEEGDRGGHGPKTGGNAIEKGYKYTSGKTIMILIWAITKR
jgi:hypothetical protein